mgnify:CR=1 FL=1
MSATAISHRQFLVEKAKALPPHSRGREVVTSIVCRETTEEMQDEFLGEVLARDLARKLSKWRPE